MIRLATVLTTAFVMLIAGGTAHARMVMQTFAVLAAAVRTMFIPRRMAQSGSPRNPQASSAASTREPVSRI
jgi:hypothetical protein